MMRQRLGQRSAKRQQRGGATAQDIAVPLPLRGIFSKAKSANVSNLFAVEMNNLRSNGVSIVTRAAVEWGAAPSPAVIQRIPFEFSGEGRYIELTATGMACGGASFSRVFAKPALWATNSGNVIIANGLALPVRYNGTAFVEAAFTSTSALTPSMCDGIISHHDRVYLWKIGGPLEFLYGDVGAVLGAMRSFPLGRLGNITGSILAMVSLTIDAGHGMNDILCIITSTGQMIAFEGFDPADSSDWRLLGRFEGGAPLGPRSIVQIGADAWMLTAQGPVSIGQALRESILALVSDVGQPIADEIAARAKLGGDWQAFCARDGSAIILNHVLSGAAKQYVFYPESRSWATSSIQARDFHNLAGRPEATAFNGALGVFWRDGLTEQITATWKSSWFEVGGGGVKYIEPVIVSDGPLTVRVVVLSDRNETAADIAEATQTLTLEPEGPGSRVSLSDRIPTDAVGTSFQITLEVTARWAELTSLKAGIGS